MTLTVKQQVIPAPHPSHFLTEIKSADGTS